MDKCISNSALFYKFDRQKLVGICATHVDKTLHAGNSD